LADQDKKPSVFVENMAILATPEGIQKYILGSKKNGSPRAVYDIVRDYVPKKKKKKDKKKHKKNKANDSTYSFYVTHKSKKKKHKKDKYWHI
jgi:hypothetical protein